jgi:hypothetical protein
MNTTSYLVQAAIIPVHLREQRDGDTTLVSRFELAPADGEVLAVVQTTNRLRTRFLSEAIQVGDRHWQIVASQPKAGFFQQLFGSQSKQIVDKDGQQCGELSEGETRLSYGGLTYLLARAALGLNMGLQRGDGVWMCRFVWGEAGPMAGDSVEVLEPLPAEVLALGLYMRVKQPY